jgi:hypothetical protein
MQLYKSFAAVCLLPLCSGSQLRAAVIFSGLSGPLGVIANLNPNSDTGYTLPTFYQTVTPSMVTLQETAPASAHAYSIILSDLVAFGFQQFTDLVSTQYSGSGNHTAQLNWIITVGGSFSGGGVISEGNADIEAKIGSSGGIEDKIFSVSYSNPIDPGGDFTFNYGFPPVLGSTDVGAGVDVTPSFSIADFKFSADTTNLSAMRNIWSTGTIVMTLTQIPDSAAPEPPTFLMPGAALVVLAVRKRRLAW